MSEDKKTVPEPNEVDRDDDVHYHDVDETNVRETDRPRPAPEEGQRADGDR
jgi:hypothetical protein